jgi:hypothetical protein
MKMISLDPCSSTSTLLWIPIFWHSPWWLGLECSPHLFAQTYLPLLICPKAILLL